MPTELEWEYAADGGQASKGYTYSGSNNADEVEWYWKNAGDKYLSGDWNWPIIESNNNKTKSIDTRKPNELGIYYDMSGNVREWCWDWYGDLDSESGFYRVVKGGGQRPSRTLFFVLGCRCSIYRASLILYFLLTKRGI